MIRGNLEIHPFSEQLLLGWLGKSHGVHYVIDYLNELHATTVLFSFLVPDALYFAHRW
jgi:hypothetical protein